MAIFDANKDSRLDRYEMNNLLEVLSQTTSDTTPGPIETNEDFIRLCQDFHAPDDQGLDEESLLRFLRFAPQEALVGLADQTTSVPTVPLASSNALGKTQVVMNNEVESFRSDVVLEDAEEGKDSFVDIEANAVATLRSDITR